MAARRIFKSSVDWKAMAERVPAGERAMFNKFKAKSDAYLRRVQSYPEAPPAIDWQHYKSLIPVPGLVDKLQKEYEALKIPYPEDKVSHKIDEEAKETEKETAAFIAESNKRIASYREEIEKVHAMVPVEHMTMEDLKDYYPEYALDPYERPTFWPHHELGEEKEDEEKES